MIKNSIVFAFPHIKGLAVARVNQPVDVVSYFLADLFGEPLVQLFLASFLFPANLIMISSDKVCQQQIELVLEFSYRPDLADVVSFQTFLNGRR
ncbi:hypothetical protein JHL21_12335 [Devosia sp. WQ 349]|uniref:hypothetical protein n=1 Tax=Devosia sp. WQ 349K1 TaxID=2800329 RepID=UPI001905D6AD|nr:hypothetical protein [Devosia sp. WQ 349K1]MBK1795285.1 hypothetical protein [Devosia sp. WQ 349K1]